MDDQEKRLRARLSAALIDGLVPIVGRNREIAAISTTVLFTAPDGLSALTTVNWSRGNNEAALAELLSMLHDCLSGELEPISEHTESRVRWDKRN